jgi:hypothetical protein
LRPGPPAYRTRIFSPGIDKIGADLTQAGQQVTEFGKLFEANGLKIKGQNGQLISTPSRR